MPWFLLVFFPYFDLSVGLNLLKIKSKYISITVFTGAPKILTECMPPSGHGFAEQSTMLKPGLYHVNFFLPSLCGFPFLIGPLFTVFTFYIKFSTRCRNTAIGRNCCVRRLVQCEKELTLSTTFLSKTGPVSPLAVPLLSWPWKCLILRL